MKRQDYVFGSTTSNVTEQTATDLNNGWVELSILYSRVLNGVLKALSSSTNDVSQEVANAIVGMGTELNPLDSSQLLSILQTMALKASDFETPITASNKGATMEQIEELKTSSLTFIGFIGTSQPTQTLVEGNLWINASSMPTSFPIPASSIKEWNGTSWVAYGSSFTPADFDFFRNNNNNEGYYWFGGEWKIMSTDMSTEYFTLNQVSGKWEINPAYNNTLVHKTGNETVAGTKHFTNDLIIGEMPATDSTKEVQFRDDSGQRVGVLRAINGSDGKRGIEMFPAMADGTRAAGISATIDANGNETYSARTPATSSNTNDIATTAWFNNKMKVVSSLPSSPVSGVFYFIPE